MYRLVTLMIATFPMLSNAQVDLAPLPVLPEAYQLQPTADHLVSAYPLKAGVFRSADNKELILGNGLVRRSFRVRPDVACVDITNQVNGQQLIRSVKPEARITLNGKEYSVGGLMGQKEQAYLLSAWLDTLRIDTAAFHCTGFSQSPLTLAVDWKDRFWHPTGKKPPSGVHIQFHYSSSTVAVRDISVDVHYALYDGIPLFVKWVTVENKGNAGVRLDRVVNEVLALVEEESAVVGKPEVMKKQHGIYVETNYAFNNAMRYDISDQTTHWKTDPTYTSQVNYNYETPCLLEIYPEKAPGILLGQREIFHSVRTHELLIDSYDRERRGLAIRKMYRIVAPWALSNPIFMHLVSKNDEEVLRAIDQCASTGYEAVILSFGSHLKMEDTTRSNLDKWRSLASYAHEKGILIGGYSLFSSRRISDTDDVIDPLTRMPGGAFFGNAPCFGSKWGLAYREKIKGFFAYTGFDIWENDGPYPGDVCASVSHPGHEGLHDSQWKQMEIQKELYRWLNERGVYINAPDWYFLDGTHKIAIGYREVNFSLSREQQKILNRQNIFDGTYEKTPSMGWGFVPLTRYQGGGPEAILEPLSEHLNDYEQLMMQYYGAGVQACYRGPRLYDTEQTKERVQSVIQWYKKYRQVLNADIIHLRRADGRDWDGWLHADPSLAQKGLMMLFNPLPYPLRRTIEIPVYYTGLHQQVKIREQEGKAVAYPVARNYTVAMEVNLPANGYSWWVLE